MKLVKKLYIELSSEDKGILLANARDISQGISADEFIEYVESLINCASMMIESELNQ